MRLYHKHPPPFSNVHSSLTLKLLKFQSLSTTVQFRTTIDCAKWLLSLSFVNVTHVYFYIHRLVTPKSTWPRMGATGQFLIFWVTCGVNCWNVKKEFLQCQRQFCLRSKIGQMVSSISWWLTCTNPVAGQGNFTSHFLYVPDFSFPSVALLVVFYYLNIFTPQNAFLVVVLSTRKFHLPYNGLRRVMNSDLLSQSDCRKIQ